MNPWIKHGKVVINRINHGYDTMVIFKASLVSGDFEEIRPWAEESGDVQIADLGTAKARNRWHSSGMAVALQQGSPWCLLSCCIAGKLRKLWPSHPSRGCQDPLKQRARGRDEMSEALQLPQLPQLQNVDPATGKVVHQMEKIGFLQRTWDSFQAKGQLRAKSKCTMDAPVRRCKMMCQLQSSSTIQYHPVPSSTMILVVRIKLEALRPFAARSLRMLPPSSLAAPWLRSKRPRNTWGENGPPTVIWTWDKKGRMRGMRHWSISSKWDNIVKMGRVRHWSIGNWEYPWVTNVHTHWQIT